MVRPAADEPEPSTPPVPSYAQARRVRTVAGEYAEGLEPAGKTIPMVCLVPDRLDIAALDEAVRRLIRRHAALRHRFVEDCGAVSLEHVSAGAVACETVEAAHLAAGTADREAADRAVMQHVRAEVDRPFDVLGWPLLRVGVVQGGDTSVCYVSADHLVTDGWSQSLMLLELPVLYRSVLAGSPDPLPPAADFLLFSAAERRRFDAGSALDGPVTALRRSLGNRPLHPPFALDLPWDETCGRYQQRPLLDAEQLRALGDWCRERKSTLFMVTLAALGVALRECVGIEQAGVLIATHNRDELWVQTGIGWYANMLPLYFPVVGAIADTVPKVRRALMATLAFHELPLARAADGMPREQVRDDRPSCFVSLTDDRSGNGDAAAPALGGPTPAGGGSPDGGPGWQRIPLAPAYRRGYGIWISLHDTGLTLATASPAIHGNGRQLDDLEAAFAAALGGLVPARSGGR